MTLQEALQKLLSELIGYCKWAKISVPDKEFEIEVIQNQCSDLQICDADSDVLFESEKQPLSMEGYIRLKNLALKSAKVFLQLYQSIQDKDIRIVPKRKTFYGEIPTTAGEMYTHTKNVNEFFQCKMPELKAQCV